MAELSLADDVLFTGHSPVGREISIALGDVVAPRGGVQVQIIEGIPVAWAEDVDARAVPATVTIEADAGAQPANPPLAIGLSGITDWSTQQPFIDVMKTARPWIGHLPGQWGGWDHGDLAAGGWLDADGWPTAVPTALTGITTLILTGQPEAAASVAGRYRLTYRGEGDIRLEGRAEKVVARKGEIWFDFSPGEGFVILTIAATDPRGTGDYIRDIEIVKAERVELHEAGAIFNPAWRARIEEMRALRFMDWMATNDSALAAWADRPRPSDYTYAWRGAPVEVMVALANEVGADPWFTLPHQATDEHFRGFAEYVRDNLDPRRKAYVEYSNEIWNWIFGQAHWAQAQAQARWGADAGGDAWMQFAGMRAAQMAQIWDAVFGADGERRLIKVISTQTGWRGLEAPLLEAPLWVAEDRERNLPPARYFDAYGVTGYFGHQLGNEKAGAVRQWLAESRAAAEADATARGLLGAALAADVAAHRFDAAVVRAAAELRDGSVTGQGDDSLAALVGELLTYQAAVAREHGLDMVMYEGGTHVVGGGEALDDEELGAFLVHLNYSPEMGALYGALLDGWRKAGGGLFNAFVDIAGAGKWGSWGALRHLDDANPRWDALDAFNRDTAAWWEVRPAGAFDHGVTTFGTSAGDVLQGSAERDFLVGREGDDVLIGGGGADGLHGGAGEDTALLPGLRADYRFSLEAGAILAEGPGGVLRLVEIETIRFGDEHGAVLATRDLR